MKIYLAGPDIFRPRAGAWVDEARALCRRHGFEALTPFDHGQTSPRAIFEGNLDLIREARLVVANLNAFRGMEPDSGTAFELGFAHALGKKLWGYVDTTEPLLDRVRRLEGQGPSAATDSQGYAIENFGLPVNLMLAMSTRIVEGDLAACIAAIRTRGEVVSTAKADLPPGGRGV